MDRRWAVPLLVVASACVIARGVQVEQLHRPPGDQDVAIASPVKAHLVDGSTVVFPHGLRLLRDTARGAGIRYDLTLRDSVAVSLLALDSVVGMESYRGTVNTGATILYSTLATIGTIGLGVAIACAVDPKCFGSCPTFYADSSGTAVLEAEGFSYSIAQLFEARDVDRLRSPPAADGSIRLEVRNEAFETHYINHLELLEVRHAADEVAIPDERNQPIVVAALAAPARALDRQGRAARDVLLSADGNAYHTAPAVLAGARPGDLDDWIEIAAAVPAGSDSVALVLRLRNSLLNTILFYDIMLGDPGARSLDWVGRDLDQIAPAVELAQWYQRRMGMGVAVRGETGWRPVARLKDTGPVAWKDVAIVVPVLERDSVRIRLAFPADNWRIDRVQIAGRMRRLPGGPAVHPLAQVRDAAERADTTALASMTSADRRYLEVASGQRFTAEFRPNDPGGSARTFFLASQGYYTEWVRRGWLTAPRTDRTFAPSDAALAEALARWRITQDTLEARFMATRVPVR